MPYVRWLSAPNLLFQLFTAMLLTFIRFIRLLVCDKIATLGVTPLTMTFPANHLFVLHPNLAADMSKYTIIH